MLFAYLRYMYCLSLTENTCYAGNYSIMWKKGPLASMEGCKFMSFCLAESLYYPFIFLCFIYIRCPDLFSLQWQKNCIKKAQVVLVGAHMALHILYSKTLECSVYRYPCFLVCGKIYNQLCFLSFSVPCFPTLEINLLDEAVSNQFLRSRKTTSSCTPFSLLNSKRVLLHMVFLSSKNPHKLS